VFKNYEQKMVGIFMSKLYTITLTNQYWSI